jgi:hypothetical protein
MFKYAQSNLYDLYVFTPNDFMDFNFIELINYGIRLKEIEYVFNIINDGRKFSWVKIYPNKINDFVSQVYFTDCGFFTNRKTLEKLNFKIHPIKWNNNQSPRISSGVGKQLSERLFTLNIPIFSPHKSLAYHGDHESLMNPLERKYNKLISQ